MVEFTMVRDMVRDHFFSIILAVQKLDIAYLLLIRTPRVSEPETKENQPKSAADMRTGR